MTELYCPHYSEAYLFFFYYGIVIGSGRTGTPDHVQGNMTSHPDHNKWSLGIVTKPKNCACTIKLYENFQNLAQSYRRGWRG